MGREWLAGFVAQGLYHTWLYQYISLEEWREHLLEKGSLVKAGRGCFTSDTFAPIYLPQIVSWRQDIPNKLLRTRQHISASLNHKPFTHSLPGLNPCGLGGEKDALFGGIQWDTLSLMNAAAWQAYIFLSFSQPLSGNPTPINVSVAAEASPVGQKHEGGNWFCSLEGGVHCVAQDSEHGFVIMRGMAEGEAVVRTDALSVRAPKTWSWQLVLK
eukprot:987056-Pelagomonas_calceolata.AAC.4